MARCLLFVFVAALCGAALGTRRIRFAAIDGSQESGYSEEVELSTQQHLTIKEDADARETFTAPPQWTQGLSAEEAITTSEAQEETTTTAPHTTEADGRPRSAVTSPPGPPCPSRGSAFEDAPPEDKTVPQDSHQVSFVEAVEEGPAQKAAEGPQALSEDDLFGDLEAEEHGDLLSGSSLAERYLVSALKLRKQRCVGTAGGRAVNGVCLDKAECLLKKGVKASYCSLLGNCCYFQHTCGQKTHYKVSHFSSPTSANVQVTDCDFRVNVINRDVCQIRVDFEEFSLAQPERDANPDDAEALGGWRCMQDRFTVGAPNSGDLGFEALCGENRGQHIYIPVNASAGPTAVRLSFHLANRSQTFNASTQLPAARWLLRITQLECAAAEHDTSTLHAALANAGLHAVNKHVLQAHDADLIAPQGCLQYYPQRTGEYQSFNYPQRRYFANLHYAICFRRRPGDTGIRHRVVGDFLIDFNLVNPEPPNTPTTYINRACDTHDPLNFNYTGDDYLYIPNGILSGLVMETYGTPFANKICGAALADGESIYSCAPGPFFVYFHSDGFTFRQHISDQGFHIRYDVMTTGCRNGDPGTSGSFFG